MNTFYIHVRCKRIHHTLHAVTQELVNGKEIFINNGNDSDRFGPSPVCPKEPLQLIGVDMVAQELVNRKEIFVDAGLAADTNHLF